jgi:hypothetical protein
MKLPDGFAILSVCFKFGYVIEFGASFYGGSVLSCHIQSLNGNMVVSQNGETVCQTNTKGTSCISQEPDGNLILRNANSVVKWQHCGGYSGDAKTIMQDDGNLVIDVSSHAIWPHYDKPSAAQAVMDSALGDISRTFERSGIMGSFGSKKGLTARWVYFECIGILVTDYSNTNKFNF